MATGGGQTFNVTLGANMDVSGVLGAVKQMQGAFNGLKIPANLTGDILKDFDKLRESLNKFKSISSKETIGKADLKALSKLQSEIDSTFSHLSNSFEDLSGKTFYLDADFTAIKEARTEVENLKADLKNKLSNTKIDLGSAKGGNVSLGIDKIVSDMEKGVKTSKVLSASMREVGNSIQTGNFDAAKNKLTEIEAKATTLKGASAGLLEIFRQWGIIDFSGTARGLVDANKHADLLQVAFKKIRESISGDDEEIKTLVNSIGDAEKEVERLVTIGKANAAKPINEAKTATDQLATSAHNATQAEKELGQATASAADQVKQLQQSTQYFFSLRNMINLLKRGINEAVQSVKDLDKAMTETAVVTDYKVSDLWGMLPEYTKVANELGATTQGAYETMTLYYQQGLNQQQAFELGAETMKMARIAGLDYAETTDMMTAALRGFNMELDEVSAKRVNDVYSKLAAVTASDTEELGTAMQRTASIAASAGASFEGTTAFLAQAIETTREPAENIGTAMKTIVARFQEMKKNPLEISEVDGEEVDYNKIDAALKTIGVDLKDTNGQFRNFDEVMLDISARWDGLSQAQQRYIATTAAGSRQQSRFIAMVSNYDRTMQLMEAANNSAGASDEQFGKTMDSLESKLNQLHNAWEQFTMGIANNGMIKMAVDGLTGFLNITNKIIDTLSLGSGAIKSFLSVFAAFTGLKIAGRVANRAIGGLGGLIDPKSTFKEGFRGGALRQGQNQVQAKAISTPIVNSLEKISGQIAAIAKKQGVAEAGQKGQSTAGTKETSKEQYTQIKKAFDQLNRSEGFKMSEASTLFGQLDAKHQLSMFNNNPGTKIAMQKASLDWFNSKGLSKELTTEGKGYIRSIYKGMEQGQIPVDKGIQLIGRPDLWGEHFGSDIAKAFSSQWTETIAEPAQKQAMIKAFEDVSGGFRMSDADLKDFNHEQMMKDLQYAEKYQQYLDDEIGHLNAQGKVSTFGTFTNTVGALGDKFTQAGYAINSFGATLSQLGGPLGAIGSAMQAFGGTLSSLGMGLSGVMNILPAFKAGITTASGELVVAASTVATAFAFVGAIAAGIIIAKKELQSINDAAQEVTDTYKETSDQTQQNISNLKSYRDEFARLSKGVDSNGNNVNLDPTDYARYLEIVDEIATINPDIVEGYNAQGHAIINNNKALAETLKLEQERQQAAIDNYTSVESLNKLIKARNYNTGFTKGAQLSSKSEQARLQKMYGDVSIGMLREGGSQTIIPMQNAVQEMATELSKQSWFDEASLEKYGIESLDALKEGQERAVRNFIKHQDKINSEVSSAADAAGETMGESLVKSFDKLGEDTAAFDKAIQPVYDNLLANISNSKVFESIAPEFREALNMGLKDLASQDLSASEMGRAATTMATKFANLTTGSGKYQDALNTVETAQQKFADSLNETEYKADVQPAIDDLTRLKEEALEEGGAYGDALAEYLDNQIEQIARFTEEGTTTIAEGLNTATDAIAQAESALEGFNEATKKDFYTAAEDMRSIYDKIFETYKDSYGNELEKHTEGEGDNTFWTGAEALLSENKLSGGVDEVTKSLKKLEPWLREGKEGMDAFFTDVINNDKLKQLEEEGLIKLDERGWFEKIPEGQWENVANALGISENLLTSMLNKARQFGLINFDNLDKVREALATSDSTIAGINSNAQGQKALYVKEDTMRMSLRENGYNTKESQDAVIDRLFKEQNVNMVQTMDKLSKSQAKNLVEEWGIKDLSDLITKMSETGDYNREEILDFAEKAGYGSVESTGEVYDKIIQALDNPELAAQTSELQNINAKLDAIVDYETGKGVEDHEAAQQEAHEISLGENGIATNFAKGLGADGKVLDTGAFAIVRDELEKTKAQYEENAAYYEERAKYASEADKGRFETLAKLYQTDAAAIEEAIKQGENRKKKLKEDAENKKQKSKLKQIDDGSSNSNQINIKQSRDEGRKQSREIVENIQTNKEETTTYKAKTDSSFTEVQKEAQKLTDLTKEEYTLKLDVAAEQLGEAQEDIYLVQSTADENLLLVCKADTGEIVATQQKVVDAQNQANKGVNLVSKGDTTGIDKVKNALSPVAGKVFSTSLTVGTGNSISVLTSIWNLISKIINNKSKATSFHVPGVGGHTAPETNSGATGINNYISPSLIPSFNSAARGKGRLGPKGTGGPTLTGELGYEIAWLPSENRSMILGANGPQMVDLPKDAVVWTHEQSKKILKQKAIPAGSHSGPSATGSSKDYIVTYNVSTGASGSKDKKINKKNNNNSNKTTKEIAATSKKVWQWWEQISRQVKATQRNAEKLGDKVTKTFNDIRASIADVNKVNEKFVKAQKKSIELNQEIVDKSQKRLNALADGGTKANRKAVKKARKAVKNAKTPKAKKKAQKKLKKLTSGNQWANVEWKSGKKDNSQKVDMSQFIDYDEETGAYYVNKAKINAKTKDSKAKRKAIRDKAYELIDKYQGRRDDAQDDIDKAQDELADYRKQIDDTFFGWKNELTEIYKITGQIEQLEAKIGKERSLYDYNQVLLDQQDLSRGMTKDAGTYLAEMKKATEASKNYYKDEREAKEKLVGTNSEIRKEQALSGRLTDNTILYETIEGTTASATEKAIYDRIKNLDTTERGSGNYWDELSEQEKHIYARGRAFDSGYITGEAGSYSINSAQIETDRASGKISEELYNLIKETYDTLHEYDVQYLDTEAEIIDLRAEELKTQQEYDDTVKQISEQLYGWKNTLTKILELTNKIEQTEKRTSLLKSGQDYYSAKQKAGYDVSSTEILSAYVGQMASVVTKIQDGTELLEKRRQDLRDYIGGADLFKQIENIKSLPQNDVTRARLKELADEAEIRKLAQEFVKTSYNADGTVAITFKSDELEKEIGTRFDSDTASKIESYAQELVNKNNEIAEQMAANVSDITELYTALNDLRQEYTDRAKELREAYSAQQQKVIDNIKTLYSAVDNNFKELISQVKQNIQQRRQAEDNAKTEQDISKKQQRLAMLRADTSGGNKVAIAQLEKEIADAQRAYGRTLEDQMIDKLSQQGDAAAKQRQQQIDLMQAQRDIAQKTGQDAAEINEWLNNPAQHKQEIEDVLKEQSNWSELTAAEQTMLSSELTNKLTTINTTPAKIEATEKAIGLLGTDAIPDAESNIEKGTVSAIQTASQLVAKAFTSGLSGVGGDLQEIGNALNIKLKNTDGAIKEIQKATDEMLAELQKQIDEIKTDTTDNAAEASKQTESNNPPQSKTESDPYKGWKQSGYTEEDLKLIGQKKENFANMSPGAIEHAIGNQVEQAKQEKRNEINQLQLEIDKLQTDLDDIEKELKNKQKEQNLLGTGSRAGAGGGNNSPQIRYLQQQKSQIKTNLDLKQKELAELQKKYKFKKGGLASQTGPAWLDGTPSKPELVLNATDTKNFLALRDVLSKAMNSTNSITNSYGGDATYEININVDKLTSDYDVDKVAERVKKIIVKDSSYRNVTQVRNFR